MLAPPTPPELLSPAGDWDSMLAAVTNHADAVYFGLANFNARQRAANFTADRLQDVVSFLHDRNVRAYLTLNTLLFPSELDEAARCVATAAEAGVDAVIVQDPGVAALIRRMAPSLPVHASTQMTLSDVRGIALARALGVSRVILPRELPIGTIRGVAAACGIPVEVFVHGAMCVSFSGQCLASAAIGGRSGNRGQCAQPCRLPYTLIVDGRPRELGGRRRLLSPLDLCALDLIPDLLDAGVAAFKIEGRLKSAEYVGLATRLYRHAIDDAVARRPHKPDPDALACLEQSFSRGWGSGHLKGTNRAALVDGRTEGHRGVRLGVVAGVTARGVLLKPDATDLVPKPGDGLLIESVAGEESDHGGRVYVVKPAQGRPGLTEVQFGDGDVDLSAVRPGLALRRTDDPALRKRVQSAAPRSTVRNLTPVSLILRARLGGAVTVSASTADGVAAEATWPGPVSAATTHAATEALVREQFSRLGDTPFRLGGVTLDLDGALLLPKSVLNDLRRRVVESLLAQRRQRARHGVAEPQAVAAMRRELLAGRAPAVEDRPHLHVLVREAGQLDALLDAPVRPDMVYCDFASLRTAGEAVSRARRAGMPAAAVTPRIQLPGEDAQLGPIIDAAPDAFLVRTLGALSCLRERVPETPLIADFSLNAANELAVQALLDMGVTRVTAAYDLAPDETLRLLVAGVAHRVEIVVHKHVPFMHMEHCLCATFVAGADRPCGQFCRAHRVALRDRMDVDHPVRTDTFCRTTVYFGKVSSSISDIPRLNAAGCRHFRVELLDETPSEAMAILRAVQGESA